ncbi:MAG: preprotein translocase subunit YajC [Actinobacteria bacterium]|jgi:preprotein translocase subunit YajC|nr:preprotein translocase subunit YajC [Actinomycetota bacterium]NBP53013.1 preprotein translocase subunit YajC [Actinomycetota bacterium]
MFSSPLGLIAAEDSSSGGGAAIFQLFFFGLIFVAMYFLLIRPQRRRTRDAQALNRALAEGDEVQTASGIVGFITGFDKEDQAGDVAWIEIAENVEIRVMRSAISRRVNASSAAASEPAADEKDDKK